MNFNTLFKVLFCDLVILSLWPQEAHRGSLHTRSDMQFTLHLCKLYQTGESTMAPTQREPEQKHYRREISQACRTDLLDSGMWAEQWELEKSVSCLILSHCLLFLVSPFFSCAALCKWQHLDKAVATWRLNKTITRKDKVAFRFEYKSISWG